MEEKAIKKAKAFVHKGYINRGTNKVVVNRYASGSSEIVATDGFRMIRINPRRKDDTPKAVKYFVYDKKQRKMIETSDTEYPTYREILPPPNHMKGSDRYVVAQEIDRITPIEPKGITNTISVYGREYNKDYILKALRAIGRGKYNQVRIKESTEDFVPLVLEGGDQQHIIMPLNKR